MQINFAMNNQCIFLKRIRFSPFVQPFGPRTLSSFARSSVWFCSLGTDVQRFDLGLAVIIIASVKVNLVDHYGFRQFLAVPILS